MKYYQIGRLTSNNNMKYNLPQIYRNLEKNTMQTNHLCKTLQSNNNMTVDINCTACICRQDVRDFFCLALVQDKKISHHYK